MDLESYYKINFALIQYHKYSLTEIELIPWEKRHVELLKQHLERKGRNKRRMNLNGGSSLDDTRSMLMNLLRRNSCRSCPSKERKDSRREEIKLPSTLLLTRYGKEVCSGGGIGGGAGAQIFSGGVRPAQRLLGPLQGMGDEPFLQDLISYR